MPAESYLADVTFIVDLMDGSADLAVHALHSPALVPLSYFQLLGLNVLEGVLLLSPDLVPDLSFVRELLSF